MDIRTYEYGTLIAPALAQNMKITSTKDSRQSDPK
jgi:hypothetical protein